MTTPTLPPEVAPSSLSDAHQRLRASIAWLRDGVPTARGIGVADMVAIEEALSRLSAGQAQPVARSSEHFFALRDAHHASAERGYFTARPEEDNAAARKNFTAGFYRGFADGELLPLAQPAATPPDAGVRERTPMDFALEHAEYLARDAENLLKSLNAEDEARSAFADDESDDDTGKTLERLGLSMDEAAEARGEAVTALRSGIYEFRKRRDRAISTPPAAASAAVREARTTANAANARSPWARELERLARAWVREAIKSEITKHPNYASDAEDEAEAGFLAALAAAPDVPPATSGQEDIDIWNRCARGFGFDGFAGMLNAFRHGEVAAPPAEVAQAEEPDCEGQPGECAEHGRCKFDCGRSSPPAEDAAPLMANGMTEAETTATASVVGLSQAAPVDALPEPAFRLKWKSGAYYVSEPNIGNTDVYTADQMRAYARAAQALVRATPRAEAWRPIVTAPVDEVVLVAAEFDGPGDWRIKAGYLSELGTWIVWGESWQPTRWMPLPPPPGSDAQAPSAPRAEEKPLTEERRLRAVEEHCWDVRCIDLPTGAGDADVGWQVIEHYEAKPHERVRGAMWARTPGEAIDAAIAHVAGDLAIARRAHGIGTHPEAEGGAS